MLTENGKIVAVEDRHLWVETVPSSTCGSCEARQGCGQGLLQRWMASNAYLKVALDGRSSGSFAIGDNVTVGIAEDLLLKSSLLMYCLPLIGLMVGGGIGHFIGYSDPAAMIGSLGGLLAGGLLVQMLGRLMQDRRRLQPVLVDRLPAITVGPAPSIRSE